MRRDIFPLPVNVYSYIPNRLPNISQYLIELEMPIEPIYYAPPDIKYDTAESVRVFNLHGDEKI
jgi:hypothetical protein